MPLQTRTLENTDTLKEIQKALKRENPASVLDRYTDDTLIEYLCRQQRPGGVFFWCWLALLCVMVVVFVGALARFWKLPPTPALLFVFQTHLLGRLFSIKPAVLEQVNQRLEQASMLTLLDAYALNIPQLVETIQEALAKRLAVTTTEDLEMLTSAQRKQLVRFTLTQTQVHLSTHSLGKPLVLSDAQAQAATVGFLALASLKQPGAERISPRKVRTTKENLKQAIEEYQLAMRARV